MSSQTTPVVVGYDGSATSDEALRWATKEAERRHAPLRIVEVFEVVIMPRPYPSQVVPSAELRKARESGLSAVAKTIRERHPQLTVETAVLEGMAAPELIEQTAHARLLVVGSRGLGGFAGLLLGSVAVQVGAHAQCPVVVVPQDLRPRMRDKHTVVVGVDGSKESAKAIDFAFDQASAGDATVVALHAWRPTLFDDTDPTEAADALVSAALAGARAEHPGTEVDQRVVRDHPIQALLNASLSADLVVVGSRGHGGFAGLLLGSVSQGVLHHTHCPVAIVR